MEMMPDIAICDPEVTVSMPAKDYSRNWYGRSDTCTGSPGIQSGKLCVRYSGNAGSDRYYRKSSKACADGTDMKAREIMLQASMVAEWHLPMFLSESYIPWRIHWVEYFIFLMVLQMQFFFHMSFVTMKQMKEQKSI